MAKSLKIQSLTLRTCIAMALGLSLSHCGSLPPPNKYRHQTVYQTHNTASQVAGNTTTRHSSTNKTTASKPQGKVQRLLRAQYQEWKGVRYRLGGTTKAGIDCSAFVRTAMKNGLGINLPRTTEAQSGIGTSINRNQLRPGDLVFFKTGWSKTHVGIYMGNQVFLHASTSRGVMLSRIDNVYWREAYWHARRVLR